VISRENLPAQEWIGLECKVIASTDPSRKGMKGKIVDESRNTVTIETNQGEKILPKKEVELEIILEKEKVVLKTKEWCVAPENRIKAFLKKKK
jgi:ribonuclease P protein subunit POP4